MRSKILSKTKKYVTVRIPVDVFGYINLSDIENRIERARLEDVVFEEFKKTHYQHHWFDEYGTSHECWKNKTTDVTVRWSSYFQFHRDDPKFKKKSSKRS